MLFTFDSMIEPTNKETYGTFGSESDIPVGLQWLVQAIVESDLGHESQTTFPLHIDASPRNTSSTLVEGIVLIQGQDSLFSSPVKIVQAIRDALSIGQYTKAQHLANVGISYYPDNKELVKIERIISPPVIRSTKSTSSSWSANRDWLRINWNDYLGMWVALKDGKLLGTSSELDDLVKEVHKSEDILFTLIK